MLHALLRWWTFVFVFAGLLASFACQWDAYHTRIIFLGVVNGPTEAVLVMVGAFFVSAIFGNGFWTIPVWHGLTVAHIVLLGGHALLAFLVVDGSDARIGRGTGHVREMSARRRGSAAEGVLIAPLSHDSVAFSVFSLLAVIVCVVPEPSAERLRVVKVRRIDTVEH